MTGPSGGGRASGSPGNRRLPSGTVTFLFTDIEGSTRLLAGLGDAYEAILDEHRRRIRAAVATAGGHEVNTEGDALFVVFDAPSSAVAAAAEAQRALAQPWPGGIDLRVRMGIHTGEATLAAVLSAAGGIGYWQADLVSANARYGEAVELARTSGTRADLADALYEFSFAPRPPVDLASWQDVLANEALPILEQAMDIYRELDDRAGIAKSLWARSEYDFFRGDFSRAVADLSDALTFFRDTNDRFQISWTLHSIGLAQTVLRESGAARQALREAVTIFVEDGDVSGMILGLVDFAGLEFSLGHRDAAFRLAAAADAGSRRTGTGLADLTAQSMYFPPIPREPPAGSVDRPAWDSGALLDLDRAVADALGRGTEDDDILQEATP